MYNGEPDELLKDAIRIVCQYDRAAASLIQRRLSIGYARAARIIDQLEGAGVISPSEGGSRARRVLVTNADEFLKSFSADKPIQEEELFEPAINYKPKKASFLPKAYSDIKHPKEMLLGFDEKGKALSVDFAKIGNLIVTGNPISKKGELVENFLLSTLSNFTLEERKIIICDTKYLFTKYAKMPHLLSPIINGFDREVSALRWSIAETDRRHKLKAESSKDTLPDIYFIYNFDFSSIEIEDTLIRLTSLAYPVGFHLIILTDQLSMIPKMIRENIPARIHFDKYGEYKAVYEFKENIPLTTTPVNGKEVEKYLENIH